MPTVSVLSFQTALKALSSPSKRTTKKIIEIIQRTLDDIGTKYGVVEVNKAVDGEMMMNIVSAVTGSKTVSLKNHK